MSFAAKTKTFLEIGKKCETKHDACVCPQKCRTLKRGQNPKNGKIHKNSEKRQLSTRVPNPQPYSKALQRSNPML